MYKRSILAIFAAFFALTGIGLFHVNKVSAERYSYLITETDMRNSDYIQPVTTLYLDPVQNAENDETENENTYSNSDDVYISQSELELMALVIMAEQWTEPELGKRYAIDTILNRVDSPYFPNTIREVIYQPNQFTVVWNGMLNKCYVSDDICKLIKEEIKNRTNYDVMFFTADDYGAYGTPICCIGNSYFSAYS